jgi:hypothetical protein
MAGLMKLRVVAGLISFEAARYIPLKKLPTLEKIP